MAIQTVVAKFDEKLIRTAIEVELERGGQTYFVSQPRRDDLRDGDEDSRARAAGARRRRPWPDARGRARARDAGVHERRVRRALRDEHHRKRPRHPAREHDHHQPRRPPRAQRALSASRPRRPLESAGVCVSADSAGAAADGGRAPSPRGAQGVLRSRRGLQDRRARSRTARRRQHARRRAVRPHRGHWLRALHDRCSKRP